MNKFKGAAAIVTGGASGIGKELGKQLAAKGALVTLADLNHEGLDKVVQQITEEGGKAWAVELNALDRDAVKVMVEHVASMFGKLDYMFNNVGIGVAGEVRDYSFEDWKNTIDSNIYSVVHGVDAAYPLMIKQGSGHIINTSSIAGLIPFPIETAYCASKHAIVGLSHSLRIEAAELGVKVSVVCPGFIKTPIWQTNKTVNLDRDKALSALPVKMASPRRCAREILKGVEKNQATIVITSTAKNLWRLNRLAPGLLQWALKKQMKGCKEARIEE